MFLIWIESGFRGLLDPDPDSGSGSESRGLKKGKKMLNNHHIILLFSDFYNIIFTF